MGVQYDHQKYLELCKQVADPELTTRNIGSVALFLYYAIEITLLYNNELEEQQHPCSAPAISSKDVVAFFRNNILLAAKKHLESKSAVVRVKDAKGCDFRLGTKDIVLSEEEEEVRSLNCLENISTGEMYFDRQAIERFFGISKENLKTWLRHHIHECITLSNSTNDWKKVRDWLRGNKSSSPCKSFSLISQQVIYNVLKRKTLKKNSQLLNKFM